MHYYHHHIGDFLKATSRLTDAQAMAYLRLLWMYYDSEKPLPDDLEVLAFQVGADTKTVELILLSFFKVEHAGMARVWTHARCDREIEEYRKLIHKKSTAGRASAERRLNSRSTDVEQVLNSESTDVQLTNNHKPITNNQEPKNRTARGTRLPADVELSQSWIEFCRQERPDLLPSQVFAQFRDYWIAQPGAKGTKLDWDATWRNWVRNQKGGQKKEGDRKMDLLLGRRKPDVIDMEFGGSVDVIG